MRSAEIASLLTVALLTTGCVPARAGQPASTPTNHCLPEENVAFSCQVGPKLVSLCSRPTAGQISALAYRYGLPGAVENEYVATPGNAHRFFGTVSPLSPRAWISQVWFTRGDVKYLIMECVGGDCPASARLTVMQGDKIVSNKQCQRTADDRAWFSPDLVKFGDSLEESRSNTVLLRLVAEENPVERVFAEQLRGDPTDRPAETPSVSPGP